MGIKDIVDKSGLNIDYNKVMSQLNTAIQSMNSNHKKDVAKLYGSSSIDRMIGIGSSNTSPLRMITIKNPEELNVHTSMWSGEWVIEYMGRDLSLSEDNYRWDVYKSGIRGYYIIEREIQHHNWLWVRWGKTPTNVRERREHIDKKRLKDKSMIQKDMITAIRSLINK